MEAGPSFEDAFVADSANFYVCTAFTTKKRSFLRQIAHRVDAQEGVMSFMESDDDKIIIEPPNSMNRHAKKTVTNTFHTTVLKDVSLAAPKDNEALNTGQGHQTGIATRQMVCVFSFDLGWLFFNVIKTETQHGRCATNKQQQF